MSDMKDLSKQKVRRTRTSASDPKKYTKLQALDCYSDVLEMLHAGYAFGQVAEFIQTSGEYTDVKRRSLEKILSGFYKEMIPDINKVAKAKPEAVEEALTNFEHQVDVLNELGRLYRMQMERIDLNLKRERQVGMMFKTTGREVQIASQILQQIGEFQQDYGMRPRTLGTLNLEAKATVNLEDKLGVPSGFISSPKKRERIIQFIRRVETMDPRAMQAAALESEDDSVIDIEPNQADEDDE